MSRSLALFSALSSAIIASAVWQGDLNLAPESQDFSESFAQNSGSGPHNAVVPLNRWTFKGNVLDNKATEHWIALFCVDWYEPCQEIRQIYEDLGYSVSMTLNKALLMSSMVRFGKVDCASDKPLCNEQLVDDYPNIVHYHRGEQVAKWRARGNGKDASSLQKFLDRELGLSEGAQPRVNSAAAKEQKDEFGKEIVRALFGAGALLAMGVSIVNRGLELHRTVRLASTVVKDPEFDQKPANCNPQQQPNDDAPLARCLPKEWMQRDSIDL